MRDGQPIAMNFKVCRFARLLLRRRRYFLKIRSETDYAGNKRIFKAVVTTAVCHIVG